MNRNRLGWLALLAALAVVVALQVVASSAEDRAEEFAARADVPTVAPGVDVLAGIVVVRVSAVMTTVGRRLVMLGPTITTPLAGITVATLATTKTYGQLHNSRIWRA